MAIKLTLGERQVEALLSALSVGIDNMQDTVDHDDDGQFKQSEVNKAMEAYRKVNKALVESRLRSMATE